MGNDWVSLTQNQQKLSICPLGKLPHVPSDKKDGAPAWTEFLSVKQGHRLALSMVVRVLQRCFKIDDKVRHPGRLSLMELTGVTL